MDIIACSEAQPQREVQVRHELNVGSAVCEKLGNIITKLGDRLTPVLRNEPAMAKEECAKTPDNLVPLAHEIRAMRELVEDHISRLEGLLERLEL